MGKYVDLTGQRFGRLVVLCKSEKRNNCGEILWRCKCDCGKETFVVTRSLKSLRTQSCGCLHKEWLLKKNITHGGTHTKLFDIWRGIKQRCYNSKNISYKNYGGRGIAVCKEWRNNYQAFYEWAMANGYRDNLTIERIDNNGNYEPANCCWVTREVQANNCRHNRYITYKNETHSMADWARILGINYHRLRTRIQRGWDIEKAFIEQ